MLSTASGRDASGDRADSQQDQRLWDCGTGTTGQITVVSMKRTLLGEVYGRFTEGFDTADLTEAEHQLRALWVRSRPT
jgi:hypothetical protein